jgi:hypothetical protein
MTVSRSLFVSRGAPALALADSATRCSLVETGILLRHLHRSITHSVLAMDACVFGDNTSIESL